MAAMLPRFAKQSKLRIVEATGAANKFCFDERQSHGRSRKFAEARCNRCGTCSMSGGEQLLGYVRSD